MIKYKLSKYLKIKEIDSSYDAIPEKYATGYFIMYDEIGDNEYLINSTIKYYINKFSVYKTEEEVLKEVEEDLESDNSLIKATCARFFDFLRKTKFLAPDNKPERIVTNDTLYKEGDRIDGFHISKVLSGRSYTDVYFVTDAITRDEYVMKLLNRKKTVSDSRYQQEFISMEQEFRMLQRSKHIPSINKVFDFKIAADNDPYLILEYIDGKSLSRYIKENNPAITHSDCLKIIKGIINAFSCLHENNILHGDIHSANILITQKTEVKIIDLGMSREVLIEDNKIVKSGGAYHYMPPERINVTSFQKFSKDADLFSDVYQVGILIYFVLYHTLPFEGFIWEELAQRILENNVSCGPVSFLNHPISPALIKLIKKCLDRECSRRYRNASEILADFRKHVIAENQLVEI